MAASEKVTNFNFEKFPGFSGSGSLYSPAEDKNGNLCAVTSMGAVLSYQQGADAPLTIYQKAGRATGIVFDAEGGCFIADCERKAIICPDLADPTKEPAEVVKECDGVPLLGPNSLLLSKASSTLYFTDSGKFEESTYGAGKGSVFAIDLDVNVLKPIVYRCLSLPSGLALSQKENVLYVAETSENRILRVVLNSSGQSHCSVFYQFAGGFGPTALAMHNKGYLFVARYDMPEMSPNGVITVINEKGEWITDLVIPQCPEITGLWFSKPDVLYMTEKTNNFLYKIRFTIK
jgi:sugar lactone lactonase YvrE